jgi:hypothetical protein
MLENTFDFGQVYVALSRVKSLAGLWLSKPILPHTIKAHPHVLKFYSAIGGDSALANDGAVTQAILASANSAAAAVSAPAAVATAKKWAKTNVALSTQAPSTPTVTAVAAKVVGAGAPKAVDEASAGTPPTATKTWQRANNSAAAPAVVPAADSPSSLKPTSSRSERGSAGGTQDGAVLTTKSPANSKKAARTYVR